MTPAEYCQNKAAKSGSSFYYSFLFLPEKQRLAITALYAFCREVDGYKHIFIKNLTTGTDSAITEGPRDNIQPAWSVDGTNIAFVRSNRADGKLELSDKFGESVGGDIWKYSIESGKEMKLLEKAYNPSFSPDENQLDG